MNYSENIKLLDCTLRDGGHVNAGVFGRQVIKSIIANLIKAKVDIIEAGFLSDDITDEDTAKFKTIGELKKYLPSDLGQSKISLMADNVDVQYLEDNDGTVEFIRLSFRKNEFPWAEKSAEILKQKGYKIFINPIHGSSFTDEEYLEIIHIVNRIKPYGFSIVDTFGAMRGRDLARIYYLVENNLDKDITLGIHLHENLGLSYSMVQQMLNIIEPSRSLVIDGSLYGMGKIPGNLCIEHVMDYLNCEYKTQYAIEPVYDAIDDFIMPIYEKKRWGYTVPYAISAQCGVHRTYAEYLTNKDRLHTKDIRRMLCMVEKKHQEIFNKEHIEEIYRRYMLVDFDDSTCLARVKSELKKFEKFIIVAPGTSINDYLFSNDLLKGACVITVNFVYDKIPVNYAFFTNAKRLNSYDKSAKSNLMITSNLIEEDIEPMYIFSRNELSYHDDIYCDDSTLMLFNLLKSCGIREIYVAGFDGFDGFDSKHRNFYNVSMDRPERNGDYDKDKIVQVLQDSYSDINIVFLTQSIYE